MEQRLVYEQQIAGKLEQLPLPDMADVIWARIEQQLDIDLPTDDGGNNTPTPAAPFGTGPIGWGLSVLVVALITAFLFYKNRPQTDQPETQLTPVPTEQIQQPVQNTTVSPQVRQGGTIVTKAASKIPEENPEGVINAATDSVTQQPVVSAPFNTQDSLTIVSAPPPLATPITGDSVNKAGKKRGVRGISDADYRIVPVKKDSM